jgi:hypothetical protein
MLIILLEIYKKQTFKENINITLVSILILSHFYFIFKEEGIYFLPQPLLVFLYKEERAGEEESPPFYELFPCYSHSMYLCLLLSEGRVKAEEA